MILQHFKCIMIPDTSLLLLQTHPLYSTWNYAVWVLLSATSQPSEWLNVWETFATESKPQSVGSGGHEPRGEPLNSAPADRRVCSQCLVSSLASDVAFSETVRCWCYSKLMLVWVVRFINDVAVAESDMGIFMKSRLNIRNCVCTFREFFVLFFVVGQKIVASYFSFIFRPKIYFHFRRFYFFGRKQKNHFR